MHQLQFSVYILIVGLSFGCKSNNSDRPLFELKDNAQIGINFSNDLIYDREFNVYKYRNYYNGGGVAIGDINNDGMVDIYLTANQDSNRLFLNKGNFQFEEITALSGTYGERAWSTGVTMVDINADGLLDIYVCNSGDLKGDDKENELFINNGDLTFTESADAYNLNDRGYSTHATFFDYDKDGDLDVYILNNSYQAIGSFNLKKNERPKRDSLGGDKLMRNDDGYYTDVSEAAGIFGSVIGFGLGITVGDVNNDTWEDIFVSNDFFERDYLYINQKDGTFKEDLTNQMMSISGASMGADLADINNDGRSEIFVTEMLPYEYERLKTVTTFESWDKYNYNVSNDYHHQFTRNTLHFNNGDSTFSEISRLTNLDATDWSWGALFFDMDNDGYKDLFVSNGIYRDLTNQDYLQYIANEEVVKSLISEEGVNYRELIDIIPSNKVRNCSFKNLGNLKFEKYTSSGLDIESFSNGSAYGDLDNDGDLDLVVNNVNSEAFVFENKLDPSQNNYIKIILQGPNKNKFGVGAQIRVFAGNQQYYYEVQPCRGFQSSVDPRPNIGLGNKSMVDIQIKWPSGKISILKDVATNQSIIVGYNNALESYDNDEDPHRIFTRIQDVINYDRRENQFIDFNRERLLYTMRSNEGPQIAKGDLDGDGHLDLVVPAPKGSPSRIFFGNGNNFVPADRLDQADRFSEMEHVAAMVLDIDGDDDLDIYLASGSVEHSPFSSLLDDQLYINDGSGYFSLSEQTLPNPTDKVSTKAIAYADYDQDGDLDLFIGERVKIGSYGLPGNGYILQNDGTGTFSDVTAHVAPELTGLGMITDAVFADMDNDGDDDLVIVGEFMSIELFINQSGTFERKHIGQLEKRGWWNTIHLTDFDNNGYLDIIAGNHGLNSRFKATSDHPIRLYVNDFDKNGFTEGILTFNAENEKDYPYALRHTLVNQIKELKRKFPDFESFKSADISLIFSKEQIDQSLILETDYLRTSLFMNMGGWQFKESMLPTEVQFSPIYAIESEDFDGDGDIDLVCGGNQFRVQPEMGIYDATRGVYLENDGTGTFQYIPQSGFSVNGEIRDIEVVNDLLMVFRSEGIPVVFQYKSIQ